MLQITDKGVVTEQLADIHQRLVAGFKQIYGSDINIEPDTPDGQMIGLFSQELANINECIAFITQMLDPYQATGNWLEQRALYAGVIRRGAEYSYLDNVVISGDPTLTIPKNSVFVDSNEVSWITMTDTVLDANGSAKLNLRSQELGEFSIAAAKQLKMTTVILGIDSIITSEPARVGVEEETDGQLLKRFMLSHTINSYDDKQGITAALLALADVKQAKVIENYTHQLDHKTGVPAHSMNAIVIGGNDLDIAHTLLNKKFGGCAFFGGVELQVSADNIIRTVKFDRANYVDISVRIVIERINGFTDLDVERIQSSVRNTEYQINEQVYATRLICQVNSVPGFFIKSIQVNNADKVAIGVRECARISTVEVLIE